jgi:hypothetical protein
MILINNNFKIKNLKIIAKLNKIHNYSKLNKIDLLNIINCTKAAIIIQTFFRKKNNAELICPLSFENLKYPFICIQNLNKFRYYSLEEFIIYLNKSNNDFRDPFTREQIPNHIILYIENMIKYYKLNKLLSKKQWNKKKNIREEYLTLTHCINDIINKIFSIEDLSIDLIYSEILPNFIYYFHFLLLRHKQNCYSLLNNYINCLNYLDHENKFFLINYLKLIIAINNL